MVLSNKDFFSYGLIPVFSPSTSRQQNQPQGHYGLTSSISLASPSDKDHIHTQKLIEAMKPFGVFEDQEELYHRYNRTKIS